MLNINNNGQTVEFNINNNGLVLNLNQGKFLGIAARGLRLLQEGFVVDGVVLSESDNTLGYQYDETLHAMVEGSIMRLGDEVMFRKHIHNGRLVLCKGYYRDWKDDSGPHHVEWAYCAPHLAYLMSIGYQVNVVADPNYLGKLARQIEYEALTKDSRLNFDFRQ